MAENSKIEWTDHTFNPWEGCQKVGPGCDHCYAETRNARFAGGRAVNWGPGAPRRRTSAANWRKPLVWNRDAGVFYAQHGRRQRVFCSSLADVFDNAVDPTWRRDLFDLIEMTPNLDWLLLTKRIGNVARMLPTHDWAARGNVWLGTTIVNQSEAERDIPKLLAVPARRRFLSMEPLLGPVALGRACRLAAFHATEVLDWVIVGGESGPGARPIHPDWARNLRDECQAAGVPFLFKQWGEWKPICEMPEAEHSALYRSAVVARPHESQCNLDDIYGRRCIVDTAVMHSDGAVLDLRTPMAFQQGTGAMQIFRAGKKAAGRLLDGREWNEVPR
ncbi:phage Gp37/Gp68 family protein [Achromobacter sp.]|uniref:phage Gp37/Gp68 family protein n=1 Tax=Achromobacter sp. TaxID=134375 RepID=UPI003C773D2B